MIDYFTQGLLTGLGIGLVCLIFQKANYIDQHNKKVLRMPDSKLWRHEADGAAGPIAAFLSREHDRCRKINPPVYKDLAKHEKIIGRNYWHEYLVRLCWYVHQLGLEIHVKHVSDQDIETDDENHLADIVSVTDTYKRDMQWRRS